MRSSEEVNQAFCHLKDIDAMGKFHPTLLQEMCLYLNYDRLDPSVIGLFRQKLLFGLNDPGQKKYLINFLIFLSAFFVLYKIPVY